MTWKLIWFVLSLTLPSYVSGSEITSTQRSLWTVIPIVPLARLNNPIEDILMSRTICPYVGMKIFYILSSCNMVQQVTSNPSFLHAVFITHDIIGSTYKRRSRGRKYFCTFLMFACGWRNNSGGDGSDNMAAWTLEVPHVGDTVHHLWLLELKTIVGVKHGRRRPEIPERRNLRTAFAASPLFVYTQQRQHSNAPRGVA